MKTIGIRIAAKKFLTGRTQPEFSELRKDI